MLLLADILREIKDCDGRGLIVHEDKLIARDDKFTNSRLNIIRRASIAVQFPLWTQNVK